MNNNLPIASKNISALPALFAPNPDAGWTSTRDYSAVAQAIGAAVTGRSRPASCSGNTMATRNDFNSFPRPEYRGWNLRGKVFQ